MASNQLALDLRTWRRTAYVSSLHDRLDPYPGLEQISWILKDQHQRDILRRHYVIHPDHQFYPEREAGRHGLSIPQARRDGFALTYVLDQLSQVLQAFEPCLITFDWEIAQRLLAEAPSMQDLWDAREVRSVFCVRANADRLPSFPPYRGTLEGMSRRLLGRELLGKDGMAYAQSLWDCHLKVRRQTAWIQQPLNQVIS